MDNGVVENEMCPVFRVVADAEPVPSARRSTRRSGCRGRSSRLRAQRGRAVSPWCALQVPELVELGPDPLTWPVASAAELPAAARGVVV